MGFLDKLKHIFNIKEVTINFLCYTNNSNNTQSTKDCFYYDNNEQKLTIFPNRLSSEQRRKLKIIFQEGFQEEGRVLETKTSTLLENLKNYNKENSSERSILAFFKPIISTGDYDALESSLYIRSEFSKGRSISVLKSDLINAYGVRGRNICNLVSAGYFEEFLIPLYNSSKEEFSKIYEIVVSQSAVAVFVYRGMLDEEISKQISQKLDISKKYGIGFIHVHGIGKSNVSKIKKFLEDKKEELKFLEKKVYENEEHDIIIVEIIPQ